MERAVLERFSCQPAVPARRDASRDHLHYEKALERGVKSRIQRNRNMSWLIETVYHSDTIKAGLLSASISILRDDILAYQPILVPVVILTSP